MADKKWMTSHVLDNVDTYFGASKKRKAKAQILNQITCMCVFASEMKRTREKVGGRRENRAKDRKQKTVEMWNISSWMVPFFVCVCVIECIPRTSWLSSKNNFDQLFTFEMPSYRLFVSNIELTHCFVLCRFFILLLCCLRLYFIPFFFQVNVWHEIFRLTTARTIHLCRWVAGPNTKIKLE